MHRVMRRGGGLHMHASHVRVRVLWHTRHRVLCLLGRLLLLLDDLLSGDRGVHVRLALSVIVVPWRWLRAAVSAWACSTARHRS